MLPFVVVGSGLCAAVIATDLAATFPVRWYMPAVPEAALTAPLPSLLVPTGTNWPHAGAEVGRRIRRYTQWLAHIAAPAPLTLPAVVLPAAGLQLTGLTLGAVDAATIWAALLQRAQATNVAPISTTRAEIQRKGDTVTGILTDDGVQAARAVILANGVELMTIRHLPANPTILGECVLILPRAATAPAQWSYVFPWAQQVYLAGQPASALDDALGSATNGGTATWGIGVGSNDAFRAHRVAERLIEVSAIGSGGLLGLPLITKQVLVMLGISV